MSIKDTLVLGIGNDILTDDAIGPKLAQRLEKSDLFPKAVFQTAAAGGLDILEMIAGYKKVIILDAIRTKNGIPGTVYHMTPSDFKETLHASSFHDVSFLTALRFGHQMEYAMPEQIDIIAIEIIEDLTFSNEFSLEIASKYEDIYVEVFRLTNELV